MDKAATCTKDWQQSWNIEASNINDGQAEATKTSTQWQYVWSTWRVRKDSDTGDKFVAKMTQQLDRLQWIHASITHTRDMHTRVPHRWGRHNRAGRLESSCMVDACFLGAVFTFHVSCTVNAAILVLTLYRNFWYLLNDSCILYCIVLYAYC